MRKLSDSLAIRLCAQNAPIICLEKQFIVSYVMRYKHTHDGGAEGEAFMGCALIATVWKQ
jgi:hypothetical protein